jgi:hypothetical protein
MRHHATSCSAPANACGAVFEPAALGYIDFASFIGTVFDPACVLLHPAIGQRAYLPTMVSKEGNPAPILDQTALVFEESVA